MSTTCFLYFSPSIGPTVFRIIRTIDCIDLQRVEDSYDLVSRMSDIICNFYHLDSCTDEPGFCLNGGTCEDTAVGLRCHCSVRYQGDRCDRCSERFQGDECQQCSERFQGDGCQECAAHFMNSNALR